MHRTALAAALAALFGAADAAPDLSLTLSGEHRTRYQSLEGRFRAGATGSDQSLALRTLIAAEARAGRLVLGAQMQDSRSYYDDAGSAAGLSTRIVNALELLQAYVAIDAAGLAGADSARLTIGRWTEDFGERRFIARNRFRNTIEAFTGVLWSWEDADATYKAFAAVPVGREPDDLQSLIDNDARSDEENEDVRVWGLLHERRGLPFDGELHLYYYGLDEEDGDFETRNRSIHTPGVLFKTPPKTNALDIEIDVALQFGEARRTADPSDTDNLDVYAQFARIEVGFTYDARFSPRVSVGTDFASGDENPTDGNLTRFDSLFGPVRAEFGPTDIFTPFGRENISGPFAKIAGKTGSGGDAFVRYRGVFLDAPSDAWVRAGVQDPAGASGDFVGHYVDARARQRFFEGRVMLEAGGAALVKGPYALDAPGGGGAPVVWYGYTDLVLNF